MIHSLGFWSTARSKKLVVSYLSVNKSLASCWVTVDPPPRLPMKAIARAKPMKSMPACS